jgi:hypothetical protein
VAATAARKRKEPASAVSSEPVPNEEDSGAPAGRSRRASSRSRGSTVNYALPKLNTKMRKPDPSDRIPAPHSGDERASSADEGDATVRSRKKAIGSVASSGDLSDIRRQHEDAAAQRDAAADGDALDAGDDSLAQLMSQESDAAAVRRLTPAIEQGPWRRASVAPRAARKAASYAETSDSETEVRRPRQSKAKRQSHIAPDNDATPPAKAAVAPTAVEPAPAPRASAAPSGRLSVSAITLQDLGFSGIELSPLPPRTSAVSLPKSSTMAPRSRSLSSGPLSRPSLQGTKAPRERSASGNTVLPERPRTFSGAPSKALANASDGKQRASLHAALTTPKARVPPSTGRALSSPSSSASSSPMRKALKPAAKPAAAPPRAPAAKGPAAS